ncbi:MAG: Hpt domain-containing protein [Alphaproteobacteria bacterium]|nr:Hpt domain-containing protein [Alphaproteobacteria bacterium]
MTVTAHDLNVEIIDDLFGILGEGYFEIVDEQVEQSVIYLTELKEFLANNQPAQAQKHAHSLKSSSGQVGLQGIHDMSKELEVACAEDVQSNTCSTKAVALHRTICEEFAGAVASLRSYLEAK